MSALTYVLLIAGLAALWLVAESGYRDYETETAFGETEGGVATIEFVATAGRIVLAAVVFGLVVSAFRSHGWTTGAVAAVLPIVALVTFLRSRD